MARVSGPEGRCISSGKLTKGNAPVEAAHPRVASHGRGSGPEMMVLRGGRLVVGSESGDSRAPRHDM